MKSKVLRLLPIAALLLAASCTDDQYDLSNVNTDSRFAVKGLVVPLNMSPIKLDNIISIKEDGDIQKDAQGNYYFQKEGETEEGKDYSFKSEDVRVEKITITKPSDISQNITVTVALPTEIQTKWQDLAANKTIAEIKSDQGLMDQIGLSLTDEIIKVNVSDNKNIKLEANDIDSRITRIDKLGIDPLTLNIDVKLNGLQSVVNEVSVTGLTIGLPSGMTVTDISENGIYTDDNETKGVMSFPNLSIQGQKNIQAKISELAYERMHADGAKYTVKGNGEKNTFKYDKECNVSGTATITLANMKPSATLTDINNAKDASYSCDIWFSSDIVVNKFSGGIEYNMEGISIKPITIGNLPEILEKEGTSIELANPQLYLDITNSYFNKNNPIFNGDLTISAGMRITGNETIETTGVSGENNLLDASENNNSIVWSPLEEDFHWDGYTWKQFKGLGRLLRGEGNQKIPRELNIEVVNPVLKANTITDFILGEDKEGITGNWKFYTKLALTDKTKISYTKDWRDWGSEDLDGLTVEKATVSFNFTKDVALDAESIEFYLNGNEGKLYGITKDVKGDANAVTIEMTGGPVSNITGGELIVNLKGQGKDIKTDQNIEVSNLKMTVDGYYDKEF